MEFQKWLDENWEKDNMFPPVLEPQTALNFLEKYFAALVYHASKHCRKPFNCASKNHKNDFLLSYNRYDYNFLINFAQ